MNTSNKVTIFYSWQSDLPPQQNQKLIRDALDHARIKLRTPFPDIDIVLDEATKREPGSPNIALTILSKISVCDIFVGDITTINKDAPEGRRAPNPNVVFELGYAVAEQGWQRTILLFNKAFGDLEDIPFDIRAHRITSYTARAQNYNSEVSGLANELYTALREIIEANPKRARLGTDETQIKRIRDVEKINKLMQTIHLPTLDEHIAMLPDSFPVSMIDYHDEFKGVFESSLFHLYDVQLFKMLRTFHTELSETLGHERWYDANEGGKNFKFNSNAADRDKNKKHEIKKQIKDAAKNLNKVKDEILLHIRNEYVGISIDDNSEKAAREYLRRIAP